MRDVSLWRCLLGVENTVVERVEFDEDAEVDGMPVTSPARTALDLAREHGRDAGVAVIDHVLHHELTDRRTLERELKVMWCWPYRTTAARALELADSRAESIAESGDRMLLGDLGLTDIDVGWPVLAAGRVYWVDLRVGCHLVEVDGLQKLLPASEGGLATSTREALRDERLRQQAIGAEGLGMSRLMVDELFGRRRQAAMARIAAEEAVTRQRFGADLPAHLADPAAQTRLPPGRLLRCWCASGPARPWCTCDNTALQRVPAPALTTPEPRPRSVRPSPHERLDLRP